jgi:hypothetical protein
VDAGRASSKGKQRASLVRALRLLGAKEAYCAAVAGVLRSYVMGSLGVHYHRSGPQRPKGGRLSSLVRLLLRS